MQSQLHGERFCWHCELCIWRIIIELYIINMWLISIKCNYNKPHFKIKANSFIEFEPYIWGIFFFVVCHTRIVRRQSNAHESITTKTIQYDRLSLRIRIHMLFATIYPHFTGYKLYAIYAQGTNTWTVPQIYTAPCECKNMKVRIIELFWKCLFVIWDTRISVQSFPSIFVRSLLMLLLSSLWAFFVFVHIEIRIVFRPMNNRTSCAAAAVACLGFTFP